MPCNQRRLSLSGWLYSIHHLLKRRNSFDWRKLVWFISHLKLTKWLSKLFVQFIRVAHLHWFSIPRIISAITCPTSPVANKKQLYYFWLTIAKINVSKHLLCRHNNVISRKVRMTTLKYSIDVVAVIKVPHISKFPSSAESGTGHKYISGKAIAD